MADNQGLPKLPEFPKFPSQFTEQDRARLQDLKELAATQKDIYASRFAPAVWEETPFAKRAVRGIGALVYNPPEWFRNITPWTEFGLTPEQADVYIRETEAEIQELQRLERVAERAPTIKDYITALALSGLLTGDEAQLYELIPELNPRSPETTRLPLTDEERQWFIDFDQAIAGKSPEEIAQYYTEGFPAPENIEEWMKNIDITGAGFTAITPNQIMSSVAFSQDIEEIGTYLQLAYPPQVENPDEAFKDTITENINAELEAEGITPTGSLVDDMRAAQQAALQRIADTGVPDTITVGIPGINEQVISIFRKDDGIYFGGEKVANIDADGKVIPLSLAEEYELQETPSPPPLAEDSNRMKAEKYLRSNFNTLPEQAFSEFFLTDGSREGIEAWYDKYISLPLLGGKFPSEEYKRDFHESYFVKMWIDKLIDYYAMAASPVDYKVPLIAEVGQSWTAGGGDIITMAGGTSHMLGYDGLGNTLRERGSILQKSMPYVADLSDFSMTQLIDPRFWITPQGRQVLLEGVRTLPFQLLLLPAALFGWEAGAAVGVGTAVRFGLGAFGQRVLLTIFGGITSTALSRPLESLGEAGSTVDEMLDRGASPDEANTAGVEVFWNNMKLAGFDFAEATAALAPIPPPAKVISNGIAQGLFRVIRVGGRIIITGLTEGGEEYYQTSIQRAAMGEEDSWRWDSEAQLAATLGGMMGIGMGGGGDILSNVISDTGDYMTAEQREAYDELISGAMEELEGKGIDKSQAEQTAIKRALDDFASTPEGAELISDITKVAKEEAYNNEITDPAKRVHTEKISFLETQLSKFDAELESYQRAYDATAAQIDSAASPWQKANFQDRLVDLKKKIQNTQKIRDNVVKELRSLGVIVGAERTAAPEVGKPLVITAYRGVKAEGITPTDEGLVGKGEYWSTSKEYAETYGEVKEGVISLNNPLIIGSQAEFDNFHNEYIRPLRDEASELGKSEDWVQEKLRKMLEDKGFDGVVIEEGIVEKGKQIVVFHPEDMVAPVPESAGEAYSEGGVPIDPNEPLPTEVLDESPVLQDIGIIERVRPTRKVFEKLGLYKLYKGIQEAEVDMLEAKMDFRKELNNMSKLVKKERRAVVFRELENPGTQELTGEEKLVTAFFKNHFDDWARRLNIPEEQRKTNYITHIFEADMTAELKAKHPLDPAILRTLEYRAPKTIFNPYLQKRLGATVGLVEDPFTAAWAYDSRALRVLYYEPMLQKIAAIANNLDTPATVRNYLRGFSRRLTGAPSRIDIEVNNTLRGMAAKLEKLPGGRPIAELFSRGNPAGMASYSLANVYYTMWMGLKPSSAIRNLSQHILTLCEVGASNFAKGIALRTTAEGKAAMAKSLALRSRQSAYIPGIDEAFGTHWSEKFREVALSMFRFADRQNISDAFLAGYAEAKSLFPDAPESLWIERGDEVAADTQYLYTQMNAMALGQSSLGRVLTVLTTWGENFAELGIKWLKRSPSQAYLNYAKEQGKTLSEVMPKKNWSTTYKSALLYLAIIGLAFSLKDRKRLEAWQYTGITSLNYLADAISGELPGLEIPGAVASLITGFVTQDDRRFTEAWNSMKSTFTPGVARQLLAIAHGERDWLTAFFYLQDPDEIFQTTKVVAEFMDEKRQQLGQSIEGKYYTLRSYKTDLTNKIEEEGIPVWQIDMEGSGFSALDRFAYQCESLWSEYKDIPSGDRIDYRRSHPAVDAALFFWEQVTTLRSKDAKIILEQYFRNFDFLDEQGNIVRRVHWTSLPEIPDWAKLLPE